MSNLLARGKSSFWFLKEMVSGQRRLVSFLVGVGIFGLASYFIGPHRIKTALSSVSSHYVIALVLFEAFTEWARAGKWVYALGKGNRALWLFFFSKAGGNVSPARLGEWAPLLLPSFRTKRTFSWILIDRILETGATLILGSIGFVFIMRNNPQIAEKHLRLAYVLYALLIVTIGVFCAGLYGAARIRRNDDLGRSTLKNVIRKIWEATVSGFAYFRWKMAWLALVTILLTAIDLLAGMILYRAIGASVNFWVIAFAAAVHGIVAVVPFTPSVLGIPYFASGAVLYFFAGVNYEQIAAAIGLHVVFVNAVFWFSTALAFVLDGHSVRNSISVKGEF